MDVVSHLLVILACLVLSAFFSGSETAMLRLGSHEVEEEVRELRGPSAIAVRDLLGHTSRMLVTILLGNNIVNILGAAVASALAIQLQRAPGRDSGGHFDHDHLGADLQRDLSQGGGRPASTWVLPAQSGCRSTSCTSCCGPFTRCSIGSSSPLLRRITGGIEGEDSPSVFGRRAAPGSRCARGTGQEEGSPLAIIGATSAARPRWTSPRSWCRGRRCWPFRWTRLQQSCWRV